MSLPAPPTLAFSTGGTVSGFAGCNEFFGESEIGEGTIKLGQFGATARGCMDPNAETVEIDYLEALEHATGWRLGGDTMTLMGSTELVFSRNTARPLPSH